MQYLLSLLASIRQDLNFYLLLEKVKDSNLLLFSLLIFLLKKLDKREIESPFATFLISNILFLTYTFKYLTLICKLYFVSFSLSPSRFFPFYI